MAIFGWIRDKKKAAREWIGKGDRAATPEAKNQCYDRATEMDPNNANAWTKKGFALYSLNRYEEAIQCYEKVIEIDPNNSWAWENKGDMLRNLKRHEEAIQCYEEAIRCYEKVIEIDPNNCWAWNYKGDILRNLKRHEEAIQCYDRAIEIDPNHRGAWSDKGNALADLNQYEEAIRCYDRVIEIDSNNANTWTKKGNALYSLNRYDEAIKCYDRAIEIDPNHRWAWRGKGNALYSLSRYDEAIKCYERALEIDPYDDDAWCHKGDTCYHSGLHNEANRCYDRALEINPKYAAAWNGKGNVLMGSRHFDEANGCYDRALEIDPKCAVRWSNKGRALLILERYDEAVQCYGRALELDPYDDDAWYYKGCTLHNLGRYDEAIQCYDKPLEIYPKFAMAWINKGDALHHLGRYDEAIRCCDRALELDQTDMTAQKMRDDILVERAKSARKNRSTFPRSGEVRQSPQPPAHPGEPTGIQQSITIERTIYDPLTQDFIVSSPRPLANVRDWIDRHDPNSYWLVICVHNHGDHAIDEWGIELDSSSALRVLDAAIEGIDGQVHLTTRNPKPWWVRFILGVSHHQGIMIPRDGSRRVYFWLGSESCGVSHTIQGMFIANNVEVPIREKTFVHSCDVATLRTALSSDPATAEKYAQNVILRDYDRDTGLKILQPLRQVQEINQYCALQNYDEILRGMRKLAATLEVMNAGDNLTNPVKQCYDALEILGDGEASVERTQQCCSDIYDIWINEFIISGGRPATPGKSRSSNNGW